MSFVLIDLFAMAYSGINAVRSRMPPETIEITTDQPTADLLRLLPIMKAKLTRKRFRHWLRRMKSRL